MDVDGDGAVTPLDPLRVINFLNKYGVHQLIDPSKNAEGEPGGDYIDVNGDGIVSPIDVLILVNHLNLRGASGGSNGSQQGQQGQSGRDGEGEGGGVWLVTHSENAAPSFGNEPLSLAEYFAAENVDLLRKLVGPRLA